MLFPDELFSGKTGVLSAQFPMGEFMETITNPHHHMRIVVAWLVGVTLLGAVSTGGVHAAAHEPLLQLLTAEEAARPEDRSYGFASPQPDNGPVIGVPKLEVIEGKPFALVVRLTPRDGAVPDLATLRVECLKSPAIDLTPRVCPYVSQDGVNIDRVTLPAGLHHFRVSVSDVQGRLSEKDFTIMVSGAF